MYMSLSARSGLLVQGVRLRNRTLGTKHDLGEVSITVGRKKIILLGLTRPDQEGTLRRDNVPNIRHVGGSKKRVLPNARLS